jgi:signal transduction histidine kinase
MAAPSTQSLASLINRRSSRCVFDAAHTSGLEEQLAFDSRAHIVMPFSIHDRPAFTLIATSHRAQSFSSSCINHIRSLGALLLARFSQDAVSEADAAKTIFLSSISHELRTPLHSMLVALRLAFDHVQEGEWESLGPLLEAMRSSSVALQNTLEDVLDFGMSQTGSPALSTRSRATSPGAGTPEVTAKSKFYMVDLVESVRGAVQLCLMQRPALHERMVGFAYESRDWGLPINEAQFRR